MKPIKPRTRYDADYGYPSVVDVDLERRGFFGAAVAGAVGLGGALLLSEEADAGRRHGRHQVTLPYRHQPRGCSYRVEKVVVRSYDKRLVAFLGRATERAGVKAVLGKALAACRCRDLYQLAGLARLQKSVGKGLSARYRKRTGRRAGKLTVTLVVGRIRQRPDVDGDVAMPSAPLVPIA